MLMPLLSPAPPAAPGRERRQLKRFAHSHFSYFYVNLAISLINNSLPYLRQVEVPQPLGVVPKGRFRVVALIGVGPCFDGRSQTPLRWKPDRI